MTHADRRRRLHAGRAGHDPLRQQGQPGAVFLAGVTADAAGNFATAVTPPLFNRFTRRSRPSPSGRDDTVNPAHVATTTYQQVRVGYVTNPRDRQADAPRDAHRPRLPGRQGHVYLHFRFGGQTKRNVQARQGRRAVRRSSPSGWRCCRRARARARGRSTSTRRRRTARRTRAAAEVLVGSASITRTFG